MIDNFKHRFNSSLDIDLNMNLLTTSGDLTQEEQYYLRKIKQAWNFYEGYHWEDFEDLDSAQVTFNYCRTFVDKYVSFELGKGFTIETPTELDDVYITDAGYLKKVEIDFDENRDGVVSKEEQGKRRIRNRNVNEFLNYVWDDNNKSALCTELGQIKSITGEVWLKVYYDNPQSTGYYDPFGEHPEGRIRIIAMPTQFVYPTFENHDKDRLESLLIQYPIRAEVETGILFKRNVEKTVLYREFWTNEKIVVYRGSNKIDEMDNPYGFIPFVQIKNFPVAGRTRGGSDLEDVIPLNTELNMKRSDISEIIDYHSAPITLVYGAKIGNLEKGANKVWGGLPKDSKVENLALQGDLVASTSYIHDLKTAMCEIGQIPETVLGGAQSISNTSGVALEYMNLPLIERTNVKRGLTTTGLEKVNKMIIIISSIEGLIKIPEDMEITQVISSTVSLSDTLPKDKILELQMIQQELNLALECRHGAIKRLGNTSNISEKLAEIDREREAHPELFGSEQQMSPNAGGIVNGKTPIETVRKELTNQNGGGNI